MGTNPAESRPRRWWDSRARARPGRIAARRSPAAADSPAPGRFWSACLEQRLDLVGQRRGHGLLCQRESRSRRAVPWPSASWAWVDLMSFCACASSSLASARFTLAKLTSSCDLSLLSASAVTWSTTSWRACHGLLGHLQHGLRAQHVEIGAADGQQDIGARGLGGLVLRLRRAAWRMPPGCWCGRNR